MATQSSVSASVAGSDSSPPSTASQCSITSAPTAPSSPRAVRPNSSAYLRAAPKSSHCSSSAVAVDPSVSVSGRGSERSADTWCSARTGSERERSRVGPASSSTMASTMAVVPTFRKVAISDRLASPTITCRRRKRLGSAWGSSRVLTMGRFSVVSSPTISSKNSARCESWYSTVSESSAGVSVPTLPDPVKRVRDTKCGTTPVDHLGEGDGPVHHVVLVAAVGVALAVGVVLVDDGGGLLGHAQRGGHHGPAQHLLAGLVVDEALERRQALGARVLRVGMVHVEAGAVGEHGVGQVRLHHGGQGPFAGEAAGVVPGRLVLEVPPDLLLHVGGVGVDQHRGRRDGVLLGTGRMDAVLGLDAADLGGGHGRDPNF